MHFVLWGLHQLDNSDGMDAQHQFQCTSCFGVFINLYQSWFRISLRSFNALRALGSSSTAVKFRHLKTLFLKGHFRAFGSSPKFSSLKFFKWAFFTIKYLFSGMWTKSQKIELPKSQFARLFLFLKGLFHSASS